MTEKVYDSHHILILILLIVSKNYGLEQNLSFAYDALQEMSVGFQKATLKEKKKTEKLVIFKSLPQTFGSMYVFQ